MSRNFGSYKYHGEWGLLDHLIVSGTLLDTSSSFFTKESKANVARLPFLLTEDKKYGDDEPFRTYKGMKYQGGISDHLPILHDIYRSRNYGTSLSGQVDDKAWKGEGRWLPVEALSMMESRMKWWLRWAAWWLLIFL